MKTIKHMLFILGLLLLLSNISIFAAPHQSSSVPATFGGPMYGYQTPTSLQIRYLKMILPNYLSYWDLKLIPQSLTVDSQKDHQHQPFTRFVHNGRGQPEYFNFIPHAITFIVLNSQGQRQKGFIYLIEQQSQIDRPEAPRSTGNSTFRRLPWNYHESHAEFFLTSSTDPHLFSFELSYDDFHWKPDNIGNSHPASTEQLLSYLTEQLQFHLAPYPLEVLTESIDIAYYFDFRMIINFPERSGHMVSFLVRDNNNTLYSGSTTLWLSTPSHKPVDFPRNSTLSQLPQASSQVATEVWLARGYEKENAFFEMNVEDFHLQSLGRRVSLDLSRFCESHLLPRR
ncbi:MAG: hypothetical protein KDD61_02880 [Bdellovibrionales bacterium]|nr:hypothetical protein [Bdellovibrionales bacterium]